MTRVLSWSDCVNVRDLGGLPASAGATTRFGAIVRSDTVRGLTDAGWDALEAHGVRTIVDLRSADEVEADRHLRDGSDWLLDEDLGGRPALRRRVPTVNVPLLGEWDATLEAHVDELVAAESEPAGATRAVYVTLLELFPDNVCSAQRAVADAPAGAVLVHCQAGKDRTGLVSALLLLLAGVGAEVIDEDYALSGPNIAPLHDVWVEEAPDDVERDRRRRIGLSPRGAMLEVIGELDRRWGGAAGYLGAAGMDDATLARAADRLLVEDSRI
jgi:protein tyrosine/serine phosphatase